MTEPDAPSTPPSSQPTPEPDQIPQKKKGMGALGWIAIGCVVLLLLAAGSCVVIGMFAKKKMGEVAHKFEKNPAMASAEMVVRMNPDLEVVDKDEDAGTMTIRQKKTGKTMTLDAADIKKGKIHFSTEDGKDLHMQFDQDGMQVQQSDESGEQSTTSIGGKGVQLPAWLPAYPGSWASGGTSSSKAGRISGSLDCVSDDAVEEVMTYYKDALRRAGFDVETHKMMIGDDVSSGSLSATSEATGRTAQITANRVADQGRTSIVINYSEND
jgi:hypothetical protein